MKKKKFSAERELYRFLLHRATETHKLQAISKAIGIDRTALSEFRRSGYLAQSKLDRLGKWFKENEYLETYFSPKEIYARHYVETIRNWIELRKILSISYKNVELATGISKSELYLFESATHSISDLSGISGDKIYSMIKLLKSQVRRSTLTEKEKKIYEKQIESIFSAGDYLPRISSEEFREMDKRSKDGQFLARFASMTRAKPEIESDIDPDDISARLAETLAKRSYAIEEAQIRAKVVALNKQIPPTIGHIQIRDYKCPKCKELISLEGPKCMFCGIDVLTEMQKIEEPNESNQLTKSSEKGTDDSPVDDDSLLTEDEVDALLDELVAEIKDKKSEIRKKIQRKIQHKQLEKPKK